ncbi:hypothetical protein [Streptomyces sp. NBC_00083]|uniref:hypothetical protein n=1 Tax=Streptomyces sp. NBC_00083 TaxID=2975647 RepID=UPI0022544DBE|nr:hypothetical protein [Streptomyces sp. NBC_00083]MCX5383926.1 hypothetical protein [Streptomyces sp. NBC_00083]
MTWASWTTVGIHVLPGVVQAEEFGPMQGDLTIHTTWSGHEADLAVQYSGAADWYTLVGSPVPCHSEEDSRAYHQAVVDGVREGERAQDVLRKLARTA